MIQVCSFSTGLSSALMTERVLKRFGAKNTRVVFMDTTIEDEDNYRFAGEVEERWENVYGLPGIEVLCEGRSPYEVADANNMVFNQRRHPCTRILKIEPFMAWLDEIETSRNQDFARLFVEKANQIWPNRNKKPPNKVYKIIDQACDALKIENVSVINIGIDFSEVDRKPAIALNYLAAGLVPEFPLLWRPIEHRPYEVVCREDWEIEPPRTYAMGFPHANCLGKDKEGRGGCVAMGIGDRRRQYIHMPDIALATAEWELNSVGYIKGGYTMLRDQSEGKVRPRTFMSVIEEYEATRGQQFDLFDSPCIHCGIGDFIGGES